MSAHPELATFLAVVGFGTIPFTIAWWWFWPSIRDFFQRLWRRHSRELAALRAEHSRELAALRAELTAAEAAEAKRRDLAILLVADYFKLRKIGSEAEQREVMERMLGLSTFLYEKFDPVEQAGDLFQAQDQIAWTVKDLRPPADLEKHIRTIACRFRLGLLFDAVVKP